MIRPILLLCALGAASSPASQPGTETKLPRAAALEALDTFQNALNQRWSYRHANAADFDGATAALRKRAEAGMTTSELGVELQKIVALGIDGHSGVEGFQLQEGGRLPFLIEPVDGRFLAFDRQRLRFLAEGFPFLVAIDGKPVTEWCSAAAAFVPKGSPQYIRQRCLVQLRKLDYWRGIFKLPRNETVEIELAGENGTFRRTLRLPVGETDLRPGAWPRCGSRLLDANIGYLRLTTLDRESAIPEIRLWMRRFRATAGLIVDVRDNTGGDRDALRLLYSYLAAPQAPPRVFTAAAYRLNAAHKADHLAANHDMYRAGDPHWTAPEREAIDRFAQAFKPAWELPKGQFSDWHYMVLSRLEDSDVYYYGKPVVVLMNDRAFSATDVFLAGLKGVDKVQLLGSASGGGSAYTQEIALGDTALTLRIGSMASFQADGRLFDGNGIEPDIRVEPVPEFFVGGPDNMLDAAVERIRAVSDTKPRRSATDAR